jgi:O-antigen/teichoic acid export membrane protein
MKNILAFVLAVAIAIAVGSLAWWLLTLIFKITFFLAQVLLVVVVATPLFFYLRHKLLK